MTRQEAENVLDVSPGASPSELKDAYRSKTRENHPDHGGDAEIMKKVNLAYEILTDKSTPSYDRSPSYSPDAPVPTQTRWKAPEEVRVSFKDAKNLAGIPADVEWLFVTRSHTSGYSSDEVQNETLTYLAFGTTDTKLVFVSCVRRIKRDFFVGGVNNSDIWEMTSHEYPKGSPESLASTIVSRTQDVLHRSHVKFNGKVQDIRGKEFNERVFTSIGTRTMAIKDWIANSGLVSSADPSLSNRKVTVDFFIQISLAEKPGYQKPIQDPLYDYQRQTIVVNGREFVLSLEDMKKVVSTRLGGKRLVNAIFGDYIYDESKKSITRMAKGKVLLEWMAKSLTSIPEETREAMASAAAQMKG